MGNLIARKLKAKIAENVERTRTNMLHSDDWGIMDWPCYICSKDWPS